MHSVGHSGAKAVSSEMNCKVRERKKERESESETGL